MANDNKSERQKITHRKIKERDRDRISRSVLIFLEDDELFRTVNLVMNKIT